MLTTMKSKEFEIHRDNYILISDFIKDSAFSMPCGGKGTCHKCKVIAMGDLTPLTDEECKALSSEELKRGTRLACRTGIKNGKVILTDNFKLKVLTEGSTVGIEVSDKKSVAVDIGTTTVIGYLWDGEKISKTVSEANCLLPYGADVISRIEYSVNNSFCEMHLKLLEQVNRIIDELSYEDVKTVVTGNTVMLSIYSGVEIESMGKYPYTPKELFGKEMTVPGKKVYLPKCISAFIGADIYCGLIASGIYNKERAVLIDIGTNGEIVLKNKEKFICTSAAAGPAFEGAGLSCGMGAYEGAVSKVYAQGTNLRYKTIGKTKPTGICGSGIIDCISQLKIYNVLSDEGIINKEGHPFTHLIYEVDGEKRIYLSDYDIYITQKDIYNILLAKSAILSSLETVIEEEQLDYNEIECVYLSGGFANYMDIESAVEIGLIPSALKEKIKIIGNGAGMGALMLSQNPESKLKDAEFNIIELNNSSVFNEKFIINLNIKKV